jgi:hypothetical protein
MEGKSGVQNKQIYDFHVFVFKIDDIAS